MSNHKALLQAALLSLFAMCVPFATAHAQDSAGTDHSAEAPAQSPVASVLEALIVEKDSEGNETFRAAENVSPGEIIQYNIEHRNQSGQALSGFIVQGVVPQGTTYVSGSAIGPQGAGFEVLIEGENWQMEPAYKTIVNDDGAEERVPAAPADYVMVRWVLSDALPDAETVTGTYRVRVRTN